MPFWRLLSPCILLISCFSGRALTAEVTLESITIYKTHEWLGANPRVYFKCKGENRTDIPDVKQSNVSYAFKAEESWQPLTEINGTKCKRCGFYEKDDFKSDDVFEEWELCLSEFSESDGKYKRVTADEFSATFKCRECIRLSEAENANARSPPHNTEKRMHVAVAIIISVVISTVLIIGLFAAYKYWQKRKRQQDQARFLKLFEEGDDIEDELGLGTVI